MIHKRDKIITIHCLPEVPDHDRRECVVEIGPTGEWVVATYNPETARWMLPYGAPVDSVARTQVTLWAYLEEVFAR